MEPVAGDMSSPHLANAARSTIDMARRSLTWFLPHLRILEPGRGIVPYELWDHLVEAAQVLDEERQVCIVKARQIGLSWLLAAEDLHVAQFKGPTRVLVYAQGEREARDKLERVYEIHANLAPGLQVPILSRSQEEIRFANGSVIMALPSTSRAGRGYTGTHIDLDEGDYFVDLDAVYRATKPMIDDSGGKLRLTSTVNPYAQTMLFQDIARDGPGHGFKVLFYPWDVRPGRDEGWRQERLAQYSDPAVAAKEYPRSLEEALAPAETLMAFPLDILELMKEYVREPIEVDGQARIWQRWTPGGRYVAASDTSHGVGQDQSVTVVLDVQTGMVVADIQSALLDGGALAQESVRLLGQYHNPVWAIEDNDWGRDTIRVAQMLGYPRLWERPVERARLPRATPLTAIGWHTDSLSKYDLWADLIRAVQGRQVIIPSKSGLGQFYTVVRDPDHHGQVGAQPGTHDDYPLAVGIAWQVRHAAVSSVLERPAPYVRSSHLPGRQAQRVSLRRG